MTTEYAAEVLEVDPATVSEDEARSRYRTLLKTHHPDLGPESERVGREAMTTKVNAAYRWLLVHIEERDGGTLPGPIDFGDGWSFSTEQPEWWPKEPYKRPRKRSRGSGPTSKATPPPQPLGQAVSGFCSGLWRSGYSAHRLTQSPPWARSSASPSCSRSTRAASPRSLTMRCDLFNGG